MKQEIDKSKIKHIVHEINYGPRLERNNLIIQHLDFSDIDNIFDIGCGMGELLHQIGSRVQKKTGMDFDHVCVESAKKLNPDSDIIEMDVNELHKFSETFDAVFAIGVLEHIDNPTQLLRDCHRISKKYAVFCVPNICRASRFKKAKHNENVVERSGHKQGWDYYLLKSFLENNGWHVEKLVTRFVDCPFYRFLPKKLATFLSYKVLLKRYPRIGSELFAFCVKK